MFVFLTCGLALFAGIEVQLGLLDGLFAEKWMDYERSKETNLCVLMNQARIEYDMVQLYAFAVSALGAHLPERQRAKFERLLGKSYEARVSWFRDHLQFVNSHPGCESLLEDDRLTSPFKRNGLVFLEQK